MTFRYIQQLSAQQGLILGSSSPRRSRLLTQIGVDFQQMTPDVPENILPEEEPCGYAQRLAMEKATDVANKVADGRVVIGCDTIVVLNNRIVEKPADQDEAFEMLSSLSGAMHLVCSALALCERGNILAKGYETTEVFFKSVTAEQIREYIATGEPMDKAGAYGIQGKGAFLVDRIRGNLDNVVGLPCHLLDALARDVLQLQ
jgi:septum formation protein